MSNETAMAGSPEANSLESIFNSLDYGTALDGESLAKAWLEKNGKKFSCFINGKWTNFEGKTDFEIKKPGTGDVLAKVQNATQEDVATSVASSQAAQKSWSCLLPHGRARHLYSVARNMQKHQSLLALVEALDCGKPARETRTVDVPAAIRQLYHHAGWAQLLPEEMSGWKPRGVTVIATDWTFPLVQLASRVGAALATGNSVIVVPSVLTPLSAFLFAEVCSQAGLPAGVLNVVTTTSLSLFAGHPGVDTFVFCGSVTDGQSLRQQTAGTGKSVSLELQSRSSVLVFEDADLDSAVEGIIEAGFFNSGQSGFAGSRLLVQESVYASLIPKLKSRISKLTVGDNFDKNNDLGPQTNPAMVERITQLLSEAETQGAEIFRFSTLPNNKSDFCQPSLVENGTMSSQIYLEEVLGPIIVVVPFRTVKEGITIANHSLYGTAASVWTENISIALEVAALLQTSTVWINSHNLFDAAAGVGGIKFSGFGRSGGKEGLYEYVQPSWQSVPRPLDISVDINKFGATSASEFLPSSSVAHEASGDGNLLRVDKTYKLFYGGGQKRPDSGASFPVLDPSGEVLAHVPDGGRKDVRDAVDAAVKAAGSWGKKDGHIRAQILYYIAENLQSSSQKYVELLTSMTGQSSVEAQKEVDLSVERLFHWAAYCDKYGGSVQETVLYGITIKRHEPVGVIGIVSPINFPFLAFISLVAAAISRGNSVVVVPSSKYPLAALGFHQILETSDVPAGVVNIITGDSNVLTRVLAEHHDVSALWYFGSAEGSKFVEFASAGNLKRTWVNYGVEPDFFQAQQGQGEEFLYQTTSVKNIMIPMGDIFAN